MESRGKVSVIIPVYNGEKTISKVLDSLISQTYKNWDVLVVNDGSTDKTLEVLAEYEMKFPDKITVSSHDNIGQAATRNKAILDVSGEYIMFVDADDYVDPDYIECYVAAIESGDYDCVVGGFRRENSHGRVTKQFIPSGKWLMYSHMVPWARLFKRQFLIVNDITFLNISIGEDAYFNFKLYNSTKKIKCIKNKGYVWYENRESISFKEHVGFPATSEIFILLNSLSDILDMSDELNQAWFVRYVVWYLLFSGRSATSREFIETDTDLFEWLKLQKVRLKFPVRGVTDDEILKIKSIVNIYLLLRKCGVIKLFANIYCKK